MSTLQRLSARPTWLLGRANARAHGILAERLTAHGYRGYHVRLLAALEEHGPVSQAELGRHTSIDRSDVVAALNELVDRDLARRQPDSADRRRNRVAITARGRRELARLDSVLDEVQEAVLAPLSERERATLARLLAKLG